MSPTLFPLHASDESEGLDVWDALSAEPRFVRWLVKPGHGYEEADALRLRLLTATVHVEREHRLRHRRSVKGLAAADDDGRVEDGGVAKLLVAAGGGKHKEGEVSGARSWQ